MKTFHSINKFKEHYFPIQTEKEKEEKLMSNPEEYGKALVKDLIDDMIKSFKKELKLFRKEIKCSKQKKI